MKQVIFILFFSVSLISCSIESDNQGFNLDIVPISEVEIPTAYRVDSITKIPITYVRPTPCHEFSNFYYNSIGNERTVAIYCSKSSNEECTPIGGNYNITVELSFKPKAIGTYHFRFWTGIDDNGTDQYIEHEIVVDH